MVSLKERNFWTLVLVVVIGILIGSYLSMLIGLIPAEAMLLKLFLPIISYRSV